MAVHADLGLVDLEFVIIHSLHDAVSLLAELREEADVMHIVIVNVLDQVGFYHATSDRVRVLDTLFKLELELLVLVQLLLVHLVVPVQS